MPKSPHETQIRVDPRDMRVADRLAALSAAFLPAVRPSVARMERLGAALEAGGDDGVLLEIFRIAHDLKGQGGAFGYPLLSDIAENLCLLVHDSAPGDRPAPALIRRHIKAIATVCAHDIQGTGGEAGAALLQKLKDSSPAS